MRPSGVQTRCRPCVQGRRRINDRPATGGSTTTSHVDTKLLSQCRTPLGLAPLPSLLYDDNQFDFSDQLETGISRKLQSQLHMVEQLITTF